MIVRASFRIILLITFAAIFCAVSFAQDFTRQYSLPAGGHVNISSVSGNVSITGYNGAAILVTATKTGRDRDKVEVEDTSSGDTIALRSKYPEHCNCDASINFAVQVPRAVKYSFDRISSASGNLEIRGVTGDLRAHSASGDVTIEEVSGSIEAGAASGDVHVARAVGTVNARSASGDVQVDLAGVEGTGNMEFTSASGDVTVRAPANLDADVEMSSVSGDLKTDFAVPVSQREHGPQRFARGRLGSGVRVLKIRSSSGSVSLLRN